MELRQFEAELRTRGGDADVWVVYVEDAAESMIHTAVVHHCLPAELDPTHPHWRLTSLLKDGRRPGSGEDWRPGSSLPAECGSTRDAGICRSAVPATDGVVPNGDDHFEHLWPEALRIAETRT